MMRMKRFYSFSPRREDSPSTSKSVPASPARFRGSPFSPLFCKSPLTLMSFSEASNPSSSIFEHEERCPSSGEIGASKRIVVIVDAGTEVCIDPLVWTLENIAKAGDIVTFAGILPWLNIPLGVKLWAGLSTIDEEYCTTRTGEVQLKSDVFAKIQQEYEKKGVFLDIQIVSGYPPHKVAVNLTNKLQAKWLVCYRCMRNREAQSWFAKTISGKNNIVFLKNKHDGTISFANKPTTVCRMRHCDQPGYCSPRDSDCLLQEPSDTPDASHRTLEECLKKQSKM